jgi:glycosyltransferase involved in cell wall biosynthesis
MSRLSENQLNHDVQPVEFSGASRDRVVDRTSHATALDPRLATPNPENHRLYVTAFSGRRDSYQLPLALFEHGRLGKFVTDAYDAGGIAKLIRACGARRLASRQCPGLPANLVRPGFDVELGSRMLAHVVEPSRGAVIADDWLARRAAAIANRLDASVLFYEFQAELGFRLLRSHRQRRILFHFHPHPNWEHPLLRREAVAYPVFGPQILSNTRAGMTPRFADHTRRAWQGADHVIVASSCTRNSLLQAGCPADRITIVPYGREAIEDEAPLQAPPHTEKPFLLWVGSGSVRKGLHHLCRAWELAGCARFADLVVIARGVDAGMEPLLAKKGIRWIRGVPRAELNWHYRHARAFVMPSISEGFGQVYLEALANGCPVIGTRNSVLPDLSAAQQWIRYVEPGDSDGLADCLGEVLRTPAPDAAGRAALAASLKSYTWENFRTGVETVLRRFD